MSTNYPAALDAFTNPGVTDDLDTPGVLHDEQHANANDAIEAIEAELGVDPAGDSATVGARIGAVEDRAAAIETELGSNPSGSYADLATRLNAMGTAAGGRIKAIESVPVTAYGHSYTTYAVDAGSFFFKRLASRHGCGTLTNRGVSGNVMVQTLGNVESNWVVNSRGLVLLMSTVNDVDEYGAGVAAGVATTREAFRAILARLTAAAVLPTSDASFAFGAGWSAGSSSTAGSYVDVGFSGDTAYLLLDFATGSGATATVTRTGDGATVATVNTGGYKVGFTGAVRLSGFGAGDHTVRLTVNSGSVTIRGIAIPGGSSAPVVVWSQEGQVLNYLRSGVGTLAEKNASLSADYQSACAAVAADFPTVAVATPGTVWDPASMLLPEGLHPNDKGHSHYADRIEAALAGQGFAQGLDYLTATAAAPAYTSVTPAYSVTGPPGKVTGLTATPGNGQMTLAWTGVTADPAVSDYVVEYRTSPSGAWTTFADGTSAATTATVTGLTNGTAYDFRVSAVSSNGTGPASDTVTATPAIPPGAADDFNRADTATGLGTASDGAHVWVGDTDSFRILSNQMQGIQAASGIKIVTIDAGAPNLTVQAKRATIAASAGTSLVFRHIDNSNFWIVYAGTNAGGKWALSRCSGGTYTFPLTTALTPAAGDVVKVVLTATTIELFINGVSQGVLTDSSSAAGTKVGFWQDNKAGVAWDDLTVS